MYPFKSQRAAVSTVSGNSATDDTVLSCYEFNKNELGSAFYKVQCDIIYLHTDLFRSSVCSADTTCFIGSEPKYLSLISALLAIMFLVWRLPSSWRRVSGGNSASMSMPAPSLNTSFMVSLNTLEVVMIPTRTNYYIQIRLGTISFFYFSSFVACRLALLIEIFYVSSKDTNHAAAIRHPSLYNNHSQVCKTY